MSMRLCVGKYCEECRDFEPDIHKYPFDGTTIHTCDTRIECKFRYRCHLIEEYLHEKILAEYGKKE